MGLEGLDVIEVGPGLQVVDAALVVSEADDDGEAGGGDLVEHLHGADGLVHAQGVDAQVLQDGQVLGEAVKASLLLADRNRMVADALDEVGAVFREELPLVGPDPGSRL